MKRLLPLLSIFLSGLLSANDGAFMIAGNHLIPISDSSISVTKEILTIRETDSLFDPHGFGDFKEFVEVTVYYEFYNDGPQKEIIVGFEALEPQGDVDSRSVNGRHPYLRDFRVNMNNRVLPFEVAKVWHGDEYYISGRVRPTPADTIKKKTRHWGYEYYYYVYHFNAVFKPGKNIVKHRYWAALSGSVIHSMSFDYLLTPANRWANNRIDEFTLIIDLDMHHDFCVSSTFFKGMDDWKGAVQLDWFTDFSPDTSLRIISKGNPIAFHKMNFHPDGELNIFVPYFWGIRGAYSFDSREDQVHKDYYSRYLLIAVDEKSHRIARNIPYATRGYDFKNKELKAWFEKQKWYEVDYSYKASLESLTEREREWLKYIQTKKLIWEKPKKPKE